MEDGGDTEGRCAAEKQLRTGKCQSLNTAVLTLPGTADGQNPPPGQCREFANIL